MIIAKELLASIAMTIIVCSPGEGLCQSWRESKEVGGQEFLVIEAAIKAEKLSKDAINERSFVLAKLPDGNYDVSIMLPMIASVGDKVIGDPSGKSVTYKISKDGVVINKRYMR